MDLLAPAGPVYQAGTLSGNPVATTAGLVTLRLADDDVYARVGEAARPSASWPPRRSSPRASSTVSSMPATCSACSSSIPKYRWWTSTGRAERTRQDSRRSSTRCSPTASTCRPRRSRSGSCRRHTTPPCSNEWPRHCRRPPGQPQQSGRRHGEHLDDADPPAAARRGAQSGRRALRSPARFPPVRARRRHGEPDRRDGRRSGHRADRLVTAGAGTGDRGTDRGEASAWTSVPTTG